MPIRITTSTDQKPPPPRPTSTRGARKRSPLVPAAARGSMKLSEQELLLSGDAIETFARAVGGRKKLLETLAIADTDSTSDKVVNCLLDDAYASWSLRRICAYAGITVADLFASYKRAMFAAAHIEAAHHITTALPPIVEDVMRRALPQQVECPRCHSVPTEPDTPACPICHGTGTVLGEPDLDRQKLALELGRLTERRAGIMVQQNAIAAGAAVMNNQAGSLEQMQQAVGELLFSPHRRRAAAPQPETPPPGIIVDVPLDRSLIVPGPERPDADRP